MYAFFSSTEILGTEALPASLTTFFAGMSDGKTFSSPLQDPSLKTEEIDLESTPVQ